MDLTEKLERIFCRFSFKTYTFQVQLTGALFRKNIFLGVQIRGIASFAPKVSRHFSSQHLQVRGGKFILESIITEGNKQKGKAKRLRLFPYANYK